MFKLADVLFIRLQSSAQLSCLEDMKDMLVAHPPHPRYNHHPQIIYCVACCVVLFVPVCASPEQAAERVPVPCQGLPFDWHLRPTMQVGSRSVTMQRAPCSASTAPPSSLAQAATANGQLGNGGAAGGGGGNDTSC